MRRLILQRSGTSANQVDGLMNCIFYVLKWWLSSHDSVRVSHYCYYTGWLSALTRKCSEIEELQTYLR